MEDKSCAVCSKEGQHICSSCKTVRYCSKEHQEYQVEYDDKSGNHLVSSKDLKGYYNLFNFTNLPYTVDMYLYSGTIILKEDPLDSGHWTEIG